ncbi:angiopoietin-related protein 7-like [Drosophila kikkawai]|uniref:Angiopoietin-related protein 7-like n=1 Tax=Drosophila kikkawai TaxID=30033 RepID=A0A6P4IWQ7_DROKI|nr:angiopoietin-related protein 7-like [Drosophila kikkawai]
MYYASAFIALVAIASLFISTGVSETITSVQVQQEFKASADILASVDKLLLDLEARRQSLQQTREAITQGDEGIYPTSCLIRNNHNSSVIVQVPGHPAFAALCDSELAGQGWLVIQRRRDGLVNFYRDWSDYKAGFGSLNGDFFIGLEKLHLLTAYQPFELYVHIENQGGVSKFAKYEEFSIGNESESYHLKVLGSYTGTAGDSLIYHKGQAFSTFDRDNDASREKHCAQYHLGAWWYKSCFESNLNAQYFDFKDGDVTLVIPSDHSRYMDWAGLGSISNRNLKFVQMMIRPRFGCL